ncbi:hypothetical protein AtNW77_Chr2g0236591 [Arabidopsis thaliana]
MSYEHVISSNFTHSSHKVPWLLSSTMDMLKKRKLDENGIAMLHDGVSGSVSFRLVPQDARKITELFFADQLLDILQEAIVRHPDVLFFFF